MNTRRVNDTQKLIGAAGGVSVLLAPVLAQNYASFWDLLKACAIAILGGFLTFLAGHATRGWGMEYNEVAEAKVKASLVPPPMTVAPPAADDPPSQ